MIIPKTFFLLWFLSLIAVQIQISSHYFILEKRSNALMKSKLSIKAENHLWYNQSFFNVHYITRSSSIDQQTAMKILPDEIIKIRFSFILIKMSISNNNIASILFLSNGAISAIVQLIMLYFLLKKKTKSVIVILIIALVATNCVNAISFCFIGIFNVVPLNQHGANFTAPQNCFYLKPYYMLEMISTKQSPMIIFCIAVVQLKNAYFIKCSIRKPLLKTISVLCGICLLNICLTEITTYYSILGSGAQSQISSICFYNGMVSYKIILTDGIAVVLLNSLSVLFGISTVLIIRSKFSSSHVIREIQSIRQKAVLKRMKITTSSQLLLSCYLTSCIVVEHLSNASIVIMCFWTVYPFFTIINTVIYTNQVIAVMDQIKEICNNSKKWLNNLYNSLFHSVRKVSTAPTSSKNIYSLPSIAVAVQN
ncbi:hypothetical protein T09_15352 [Trichinella sp. T9]|nr:hypothetical protein T09_15352 [Trichinella sp. T9]